VTEWDKVPRFVYTYPNIVAQET